MNSSMSARLFAWLIARLPVRFQEGSVPYLLFVVWLLIIVCLIIGAITPSSEFLPASFIFAGVLFLLQLLYLWGLPITTTVNTGLFAGMLHVIYVSWISGGIYSPRMAWLTLIPLFAFYAVGRLAGLIWFVLVLMVMFMMSYVTWHGMLNDQQILGLEQVTSSFVTYSVVTLLNLTVPYLYDNLFLKAYSASLKRNQELEAKQQELARSALSRELFIATVSHELRTPMNAILGFNKLLSARVANNPEAQKILNHTQQSADHLLTVINDVLDYSQLQTGKLNIYIEPFALRDTVLSAFDLFAQRVESMHLQYTCTIDDDVPHWVKTDRHRLMQILVNLLGNAIKFTHQGRVNLRVTRQPLCVHFAVRDTGIGITPDQQEQIFMPFGQAHEGIQSRYGGNGLGLSISQRLVQLMGGHIGFESRPDHGSSFWFTLPLVEVDAPTRAQAPARVSDADMSVAQRFLVVDDHPINRLLVRQILKKHWQNCEIFEASNGRIALEMLRKDSFDVVLMDMVMPEMDGIEATAALRQTLDAPVSQTPVLGLTANVNQKDLDRFTAAGVNAVVLKPFEAAMVCAQVEQMIKTKHEL
jgi:signal transduction histidine kinase